MTKRVEIWHQYIVSITSWVNNYIKSPENTEDKEKNLKYRYDNGGVFYDNQRKIKIFIVS